MRLTPWDAASLAAKRNNSHLVYFVDMNDRVADYQELKEANTFGEFLCANVFTVVRERERVVAI